MNGQLDAMASSPPGKHFPPSSNSWLEGWLGPTAGFGHFGEEMSFDSAGTRAVISGFSSPGVPTAFSRLLTAVCWSLKWPEKLTNGDYPLFVFYSVSQLLVTLCSSEWMSLETMERVSCSCGKEAEVGTVFHANSGPAEPRDQLNSSLRTLKVLYR